MIVKISINNLYESNFRFYLNDEFRKKIFCRLKEIYHDWVLVAGSLGINARYLFGIRRGWDITARKKALRFISSKILLKIKDNLSLSNQIIEKNIIKIRQGYSKSDACASRI